MVRPLLFLLDPEDVHDAALALGGALASTAPSRAVIRTLLAHQNPALGQTIASIRFANPVGLAAGFDKNAQLAPLLEDIGFGFGEIGSITADACPGNPRPRLWRLKKDRSLLVHYGLKSDGVDTIAAKLARLRTTVPLGTNIARTNDRAAGATTEAGIADYARSYQRLATIGAFTVINISCPNAFCGYTFADPDKLDALLRALAAIKTSKPFFIKLSPDVSDQTLEALVAVGMRHGAAGFVCTNLTAQHPPHLTPDLAPSVGGISGKLLDRQSDRMIAAVYRLARGKAAVIGCGGIFSAQDAYRKIRLGASLVELITGMIYQGPQLIGEINAELAVLLRKDGFRSIADAVGADNRS